MQSSVKLPMSPTTDDRESQLNVTCVSGPELSREKFHGIDTYNRTAVYVRLLRCGISTRGWRRARR
jgi:hypothetical protein